MLDYQLLVVIDSITVFVVFIFVPFPNNLLVYLLNNANENNKICKCNLLLFQY